MINAGFTSRKYINLPLSYITNIATSPYCRRFSLTVTISNRPVLTIVKLTNPNHYQLISDTIDTQSTWI